MVTAPASPLYDATGGTLPLDFVNTVDRSVGKPWVDRLRGYDDLLSWCVQAGSLAAPALQELLRVGRRDPERTAAVLTRARALREALYRMLAARVDGERGADADLALVNRELALALAHARLEDGAHGLAWGWEAAPKELDAPLWPLARSAAELLTSPECAFVRRCASATCLWLFLDRTKNHRRRWCDMKVCGNRTKVRRYRKRRAASGAKEAESGAKMAESGPTKKERGAPTKES